MCLPGSRAQAQGLSCFEACGIFLDQGSNPSLLHWQVDSSLSHQGNGFSFSTCLSSERGQDQKAWELGVLSHSSGSAIKSSGASGQHLLLPQSCPTLCDPVDCSPPGSSVHGISQARILEWVAILLCVKLEKSGS